MQKLCNLLNNSYTRNNLICLRKKSFSLTTFSPSHSFLFIPLLAEIIVMRDERTRHCYKTVISHWPYQFCQSFKYLCAFTNLLLTYIHIRTLKLRTFIYVHSYTDIKITYIHIRTLKLRTFIYGH